MCVYITFLSFITFLRNDILSCIFVCMHYVIYFVIKIFNDDKMAFKFLYFKFKILFWFVIALSDYNGAEINTYLKL